MGGLVRNKVNSAQAMTDLDKTIPAYYKLKQQELTDLANSRWQQDLPNHSMLLPTLLFQAQVTISAARTLPNHNG